MKQHRPLAVLFAFMVQISCAGACPVDSLWISDADHLVGNGGIVVVADSSYTLSFAEPPQSGLAYKSQVASYSIPAGQIAASAAMHSSGWCHPCLPAFASVVSRDTYRLLGPEGASPIAFSVRLHVDIWSTGLAGFACMDHTCIVHSGTADAILSEMGGPSAGYEWRSDGIGAQDLQIELTHAVGDSFDLRIYANANADFDGSFQYDIDSNRSARIEGQLMVLGLPEGYAIVSCRGFQAGTLVPVRNGSWGRLKSMYR